MMGGGSGVSAGVVTAGGATGPNRVVNVADTPLSASIVTVQLPRPLHAPLQPINPQAVAAPAPKVTRAPSAKLAVQVELQSIPDGELQIRPPLPPATETESVCPDLVS